MPSHRILYVGEDLALLASLKDTLKDDQVVRSPGLTARTLIESQIGYSLLLFDNELSELASFARSLQHRKHTPVILLPAGEADTEQILTTVICSLVRRGRRP
jgi:DNA-binding response OmpR family regulator